jgi:hypothetical protein
MSAVELSFQEPEAEGDGIDGVAMSKRAALPQDEKAPCPKLHFTFHNITFQELCEFNCIKIVAKEESPLFYMSCVFRYNQT